MFTPQKSSRLLSAFDPVAGRWTALPLRQHTTSIRRPSPRPAHSRTVREQLSITSCNIHAVPFKRVERSQLILDRILGHKSSDIIFLQEVASDVRQSVLDDPQSALALPDDDWVAHLPTDDTAFQGVPFATMTLLSSERFVSPLLAEKKDVSDGKGEREGEGKGMLHNAFRMTLPSRYERDALCVTFDDPATPGHVLRLLNVHLDSLDSSFRRASEVHLLDRLLREGGCSGGIIAGDFSAIDPTMIRSYTGGRRGLHGAPRRLDKVVMLGLEPVDIEVLQPGRLDAGTPWSDHCGLRCTFTV
ncbi:Endonuclease/exonuclease/phosphatase [Dichomitus squalens]|uniref:Endonuclease/exonuclease/phosphatase n=1 Tax=Dichomitus squalens TaxID=114155 RepID=A0A4Q9PP85_9APHY|nr:Endonuclease/exonuclease/phosphatase [Dichomitus squalens]